MAEQSDGKDRPRLPKAVVTTNDPALKPAGEVVLGHEESAAKAPAGKQIHRRRPLPPVPDASEMHGSELKQADGGGSGEETRAKED